MESQERMNDNDIIKALGYCFAVGDCEHCAYADKPCPELMADALNLINRQKAENERLRAYISMLEAVKNGAVDTFIRKLEFKLSNNRNISAVGYQSIIEDIDSVVKEMTEEKE